MALRGNMPALAGIGIRALVETLRKDCGATGHGLEKNLDSLITREVLRYWYEFMSSRD